MLPKVRPWRICVHRLAHNGCSTVRRCVPYNFTDVSTAATTRRSAGAPSQQKLRQSPDTASFHKSKFVTSVGITADQSAKRYCSIHQTAVPLKIRATTVRYSLFCVLCAIHLTKSIHLTKFTRLCNLFERL